MKNIVDLAINDNFVKTFKYIDDTIVIGRGYSFPFALEAALKLKETSLIHAEGYSSAELLHGPIAIAKENYPFIIFCNKDQSYDSIIDVIKKINKTKSKVFLISNANIDKPVKANIYINLNNSIHPILDPLLIMQYFYLLAAHISIEKGLNPDKPGNIFKVTKTI